jgi:cell division septum initiation protein DivIVA
LLGAAAGLWRLDRRLADSLKDSLARAKGGDDADYRQVKQRIDDLTKDLPELREILSSMVDAGIAAQRA